MASGSIKGSKIVRTSLDTRGVTQVTPLTVGNGTQILILLKQLNTEGQKDGNSMNKLIIEGNLKSEEKKMEKEKKIWADLFQRN